MSIMNYIFDETNWADFMSDFVEEIKNNREVGIIKLCVRHHVADRIFSWVFRKLDVCLVGVEDRDGEVLYELGDRINRWLKDAQLTGYTGSYRDLLGEDEIVGITLSKKVFEDAALAVIRNKGEPLKWKRSFGIISLMISEPARFVPFKDVLAEKFIDGTEMLLPAEGKGGYFANPITHQILQSQQMPHQTLYTIMEDNIGNPIPIPRREGSYYGYVAAELTDINDNDHVSIMNYIFDETNWAD
ncbi:mRNA-capping enzyme-like protein isoform X2, partial [Tanacetum coccineum]